MGDWVSDPKPSRTASGATSLFDRPDGTFLQDDVILFLVSEQGTITGTNPITTDAGVVRLGGPNALGDRAFGWFAYTITNPAAIPATFTFGGFSSGRGVGFAQVYRGIDLTSLQHTSPPYSVTDLAAFEADGTPSLYLMAWTDQRISPRSHVPSSTPAGVTALINIQSPDSGTTGSRTAIWAGYQKIAAGAATSIPAKSLVWPDGVSANRAVGAVLREKVNAPAPGLEIPLGDGKVARHTFIDANGQEKTLQKISIWLPGFNDVESFIAKPGAAAAHRGLSLDNPEYTEVAYDNSVTEGYPTLEISVGWTNDPIPVPFGLGDETLDRAAGVSGGILPTSMSWATLSSTYRNVLRPVKQGVTQPFYRLEEMLAKFTKTHVVLVDPKFGWNTPAKVNAMIDICNAFGGPDKIIIKFDFPVVSPALVNAAHAADYQAMNYWGTDVDKLTNEYQVDKWDLIGVRYDADQAMYDTAGGFGKPVWAAVIPDQAGYNLAASRGADLMMSASRAIKPIRP
ncbi:phosphoesterase [Microbacterium phage Pabst]|nr:phosphoesterase [Microbacterium phage Pabst]